MDLKKLVNQPGATIIDVREAWEFQMGHVEGSFNIPLSEVYSRMDNFKRMSEPIILVCASGNRSGQAVAILRSQGLENVYNGGGWQDLGYLKLKNVS